MIDTYFFQVQLELGAKLAICGRRQEVAEQAAADMARTKGGETFATRCDVRQPDQVEALVEAVIQRFGRIDVLVNNAVGNFISPTERRSATVRFSGSSMIRASAFPNSPICTSAIWIVKRES